MIVLPAKVFAKESLARVYTHRIQYINSFCLLPYTVPYSLKKRNESIGGLEEVTNTLFLLLLNVVSLKLIYISAYYYSVLTTGGLYVLIRVICTTAGGIGSIHNQWVQDDSDSSGVYSDHRENV